MAKISRLAGSTSHVLTVFIQDSSSTTGAGLTGLVFNTASLTCYYKRNRGTASVAVSLVTITTLGTYVSGGFKEIDATNLPGFYEFHPPDAAVAASAGSVAFLLKGAANMVPLPLEIELTVVDNQSAGFALAIASPQSFNNTGQTTKNAVTLASTDVTGNVAADVQTIKTQAVTAAAGVTFPTSIASPTNITAGTITTVTNLTNAPTAGDLTATMKTSVNTILASGVTVLAQAFPANFASLGISVAGKINGVVLTDTATTLTNLPAITTNWLTGTGVDATAVTKIQAGLSTYAGGDTSGTTTLLSRLTSTRAGLLDNLDAAVSTRSTFAGGAVASVTGSVGSVTATVNATLVSSGLDAIPVTDPGGVATTFPQMVVQTWRRFFKKTTKTTTQIKTLADDGTTVRTTQAITDDNAGNQTQGAAS